MRVALLAAAVTAASMLPVLAAPPEMGALHYFLDPSFGSTVICDTAEQVRDIASSADPIQTYLRYRQTPNAAGEPTCAALILEGLVVDVVDLGAMTFNGDYFKAWAVKILVGPHEVWALYLEAVPGALT